MEIININTNNFDQVILPRATYIFENNINFAGIEGEPIYTIININNRHSLEIDRQTGKTYPLTKNKILKFVQKVNEQIEALPADFIAPEVKLNLKLIQGNGPHPDAAFVGSGSACLVKLLSTRLKFVDGDLILVDMN